MTARELLFRALIHRMFNRASDMARGMYPTAIKMSDDFKIADIFFTSQN